MLWKRELHASIKREGEESQAKSDYTEPDVKPSIRTQAYLNKALTHFESLRQLKISEIDNMNVFTIFHYKVLGVVDQSLTVNCGYFELAMRLILYTCSCWYPLVVMKMD